MKNDETNEFVTTLLETIKVSVPLRGNGYEKPHEVETVVIFSFQGAVAPDYAKR
uniref:hypothetical protein n=1 Tax=Nodularia spumigena TaxID=70799 RepID=UPI00396A22AA